MLIYYSVGDNLLVNASTYPFVESGVDSLEAEITQEEYDKLFSPRWTTTYDGGFIFTENEDIVNAETDETERRARMEELKTKLEEATITDPERDELFLLLLGVNTTV